jgi:hypothetical protein
MSLELEDLYPLFKSPLEKQLADMRNQLARSRFQKDVGDTKLDIGSLGINSQNYIKFVNDHYNISNVLTAGTTNIYPAFEPDYNTCKLWINTDHFGYRLEDDSLIPALVAEFDAQDPDVPIVAIPRYPIGQEIFCFGEPKLESGFDRGYGDITNTKKRQALHFNRVNSPTRYEEYIRVTDQAIAQPNKTLRVLDATGGSTWIFRIRNDNFAQQGGTYQRVINKIDNDTLQEAYSFIVYDSGRVVFQVRKAGVDYAVYDASFSPSLNTEYEYALVWNPAGATTPDKMKIYRDGVLKTNTNYAPIDYGLDATEHDLYIGKRGAASNGFFQGHIILVKYFHNFQAAAGNILDHYTNKLTIAGGVPYGGVAVPDWVNPHT